MMPSHYVPYLLADYYHWLEIAGVVVAVVILLSSLDDLFVDAWFWIRKAYRRFIMRRYPPLTSQALRAVPEQPLAIMVPAWLEYDVIALMLESMVNTLEYKNYMIFVGTYQNDDRTRNEVERMRRRYRQLIRVEVPHDGPTCKADCLNWIIQAIFQQNERQSAPFAGVILHDSEDLLHPLELKYYNYLLPRVDFIQLPVASIERHWYELVAGTYMDEFAEWHTKDLVVRESMSRMVPSAGVGTCFSRRAMEYLASQTNNQPFNTDTLTEDYDIGARLSRMGMKQIFGRFPVERTSRRKSWFGLGPQKEVTQMLPLDIREYFPNTFKTAYRQKARWTLGIGLQGWTQVGWKGSLATKYLLFRDRKGLVTSFIAIAGYFLLLNFLAFWFADRMGWWQTYFPSEFSPRGWVGTLIVLNGIALLLRTLQRAIFVNRLYGWEHALLSAPRMVIGNFINAMAAARAWKLFIAHLITGKRLAWDKTMHDFPSADQLVQQRQSLGELLMSWKVIDEAQLAIALNRQQQVGLKLGEILLQHDYLDESTLEEAISYQRYVEEVSRPAPLMPEPSQ
ncbi:glycosyl transferase family protein [Diaphorobacter aerolatus]|uniref:Glycosyl transferase family protein n=1 Tax=Diaphorobacter aerolatus TaxID=1288495 RepID=A0A7H0GPU0_9BURK|nr:glycosyl transferase family protein [Diaphorobacter aerolatus]QNP50306.1 glycosyl transferase family protein [Diaphorobacter aerolatus]